MKYKLGPNGKKPEKAKQGDAGYDIFSAEDVLIHPFSQKKIKTDLFIELPPEKQFILKEKSGLSDNNLYLGGGVIDNGYRGEILVNLRYMPFHLLFFEKLLSSNGFGRVLFDEKNFKPYEIKKGQKICQGLVVKIEDLEQKKTKKLSVTERGKDGFGSTGLT